MGSYLERYGETVLRLQRSMGPALRVGGELARRVEEEMSVSAPLSALPERRRWRELRLARLAQLKRDLRLQEEREEEEGKLLPFTADH